MSKKKFSTQEDICKMEEILQKANNTLNTLEASISDFQNMQEDIRKLADYYDSKQWRIDFEADEQGLYPDDLKRGVLSEDGIYNLLERNKEVMELLKTFLDEE